MECRIKLECGNCNRTFLEQWKMDKHTCKKNLSAIEKLNEYVKFRNTTELEKFLSHLKMKRGSLYLKTSEAYEMWKNR